MIQKIRTYIQQAFVGVPQTKRSIELQEEIISNLIDKFNDQLKNGKTEEEAYQSVIVSVGDLSELTEGLKERHTLSPVSSKERKHSATIKAIAVILYILSPFALIFVSSFAQGQTALLTMFSFIAIATGLLVYNSSIKPDYIKEEETMVEEFKEWKAKRSKKNEAYRLLNSAYWLLVVVTYLYVSYTYFSWHYSWIIFIIALAIQRIVKAIVMLGDKNEN